ncbi:hypothetical protein OGAPHI_004216 [Ogataea philodendri]|uniref:Uncharacterized protein n=1 Tax=Ogataea philodendri TaxID=1378263 RepID=A0A9P8P742_9ASCO|nr:uncharacterized protein OGAPHI_004216 [Ogataea philodendri]KAH3666027.1 hypothetical protein OGAPHI_004216 [Ogataea philodendri]
METARPKRRTTVNVNYKEKSELDFAQEQDKSAEASKKQTKKPDPPPVDPIPKTPTKQKFTDKSLYVPVDDVVPLNYQPKCDQEFNTLLDLKGAKVENNSLILKNGTKIKKGDFIYMVCEPPGEPFYIAMVKGFARKEKDNATKNPKNYNFEVCWFYRPRDLNRRSADTRVLFASLHMDECPIQSFRGFATVKHKSEIENLDAYRMLPNSFYFDKFYDRYMVKMYDVLPTKKLTNLPANYYKALNKRFEYVFFEIGRGQDLLADPKTCEKCLQWAASSDSVQCLKCEKIYHLLCLDPPITNKPKRGFAWFCAACNKDLEEKMSENRAHMLHSSLPSQIAASIKEEDSDDSEASSKLPTPVETDSRSQSTQPSDLETSTQTMPRYEELAIRFLETDKENSFKKRRDMEEWPYRYLGVHAKLEDALDLQDRPYPRAVSRLGSKHQFTGMVDWYDHPVVYYDGSKYAKSKSKKKTSKKKSTSPDENEQTKFPMPEKYKDYDLSDLPGWLQPKPKGYIERGGDETCELLWQQPEGQEEMVEKYLEDAKPYVEKLGMIPTTPNFVDAALKALMKNNYDPEAALKDVSKFTRKSLREPTFSEEEVKKFEDSVRINGSELHPVFKDVGTQTSAMIVRFYYLWKKTTNGHLIWDNYPGRPKNRLKKFTKTDGVDVNDPDDDSSYSMEKIKRNHVDFECKYCHTHSSNRWFKISGSTLPDSYNDTFPGLCTRCARLWREYAVEWEDPTEVMRKQSQRGGNGWKRKMEFELYEDSRMILQARDEYQARPRKITDEDKKFEPSLRNRTKVKEDSLKTEELSDDKSKKKSLKVKKPVKSENQKKTLTVTLPYNDGKPEEEPVKVKKRSSEEPAERKSKKAKTPTFVPRYESKFEIDEFEVGSDKEPESSLFRSDARPCCVCREASEFEEVVICHDCGLNVHASCYGVALPETDQDLSSFKWLCDACSNDRHPVLSTHYQCVLCPAKETKSFGGRSGDPNSIPDALKRTVSGNWCHAICAVFDPDCEFGSSSMQPVFGAELSLLKHSGKKCTICGLGGSLTDCSVCGKAMHVTCCQDTPGCSVGFELVPDKAFNARVRDHNKPAKPVPRVICRDHLNNNLVPLHIGAKLKGKREVPLLKLFCTELKKTSSVSSGEYWHKLYEELLHIIGDVKPVSGLPRVANRQCKHCRNTKSLHWYTDDGDICHQCYVRKQNDEGLIDNLPDVLSLNKVGLDGSKFGISGLDDRLIEPRMSIQGMLG